MKKRDKENRKKELREQLKWQFYIIFTVAEEEGWTFEELAEESGLCVSTIYRYHRGEWVWPRVESLQMLCYTLDLPFTVDPYDEYQSRVKRKGGLKVAA